MVEKIKIDLKDKAEKLEEVLDIYISAFYDELDKENYFIEYDSYYKQLEAIPKAYNNISEGKMNQYKDFSNLVTDVINGNCVSGYIKVYENAVYNYMKQYSKYKHDNMYKQLINNDWNVYRGLADAFYTDEYENIECFVNVINNNNQND